jgi:hypothetical protein
MKKIFFNFISLIILICYVSAYRKTPRPLPKEEQLLTAHSWVYRYTDTFKYNSREISDHAAMSKVE